MPGGGVRSVCQRLGARTLWVMNNRGGDGEQSGICQIE